MRHMATEHPLPARVGSPEAPGAPEAGAPGWFVFDFICIVRVVNLAPNPSAAPITVRRRLFSTGSRRLFSTSSCRTQAQFRILFANVRAHAINSFLNALHASCDPGRLTMRPLGVPHFSPAQEFEICAYVSSHLWRCPRRVGRFPSFHN